MPGTQVNSSHDEPADTAATWLFIGNIDSAPPRPPIHAERYPHAMLNGRRMAHATGRPNDHPPFSSKIQNMSLLSTMVTEDKRITISPQEDQEQCRPAGADVRTLQDHEMDAATGEEPYESSTSMVGAYSLTHSPQSKRESFSEYGPPLIHIEKNRLNMLPSPASDKSACIQMIQSTRRACMNLWLQ